MSEEERFWIKVEDAGDCWLWKAATRGRGYDCYQFRGHLTDAHRVAYMLTKGEIPDGCVVMHTCDNPPCVNPDHLELGTWADNTRDAIDKQRHHFAPNSGRLTAKDVRAIRRLYTKGEVGYGRLADEYGVDKKTIRQILKREVWKSA